MYSPGAGSMGRWPESPDFSGAAGFGRPPASTLCLQAEYRSAGANGCIGTALGGPTVSGCASRYS